MIKDSKFYVFAPHPIEQSALAGRLISSGGVGIFEYAPSWLADTTHRYALDPKNLPLHRGAFTTQLNKGLHGVFADAGPDSWGRHLMELAGRDLSNPLEQLRLSNGTGTGGLLFSLSQTKPHPAHSILPFVELEKLEHTMDELDKGNKISNQELEHLFHSGSHSLGGARPKALVEHQSSQWIAKFEKHSDPIPLPPLEWASLQLARRCNIEVPDHELVRCGQRNVLLVKRFDRLASSERVHYLSAHALLSLIKIGPSDFQSPKGLATYGNIAATARHMGVKDVGEKMFERMLFNIIIGNTDDHFRNHGFLRINNAWELAPAFDMTILGGPEQAIGVGPLGRARSLENALADAVRFGLDHDRAHQLATTMQKLVSTHIDEVLKQAQLPSGHQDLVKNRLLLTQIATPTNTPKLKR